MSEILIRDLLFLVFPFLKNLSFGSLFEFSDVRLKNKQEKRTVFGVNIVTQVYLSNFTFLKCCYFLLFSLFWHLSPKCSSVFFPRFHLYTLSVHCNWDSNTINDMMSVKGHWNISLPRLQLAKMSEEPIKRWGKLSEGEEMSINIQHI